MKIHEDQPVYLPLPNFSMAQDILETDNIDKVALKAQQKIEFPKEMELAKSHKDDNFLLAGILHSERRPYPTALEYPRVLLPRQWRDHLVKKRHESIGHLAFNHTKIQVQEGYVWPGMRKDIKTYCRFCPICIASRTCLVHPFQWMS